VVFLGKIDPASLLNYTVQADAGISLEEDLGLNYRYALPNKLFDYIQAGIPVLVSDLPEMKSVVETFNIGLVSDARTPEVLASFFMQVLYNEEKRALWKSNLEKAANELCWENEEKKLMALYKNAISDPAFQATGKKEQ